MSGLSAFMLVLIAANVAMFAAWNDPANLVGVGIALLALLLSERERDRRERVL